RIPIVVVGTKLNLVNEHEVEVHTIANLVDRWVLPFYETLAKRNWHITEVFVDLVKQMQRAYPEELAKRVKKSPGCIVM
ncbi:hypothetical protein C0991_003524, partial [Blastosporella zonata]